MDAHKEPLSKILSLPTRLVAPLFQRPYVWKREDNWEPLWEAMLEVLDRRVKGDKPRPYFMGAIVLDKAFGGIGAIPSREIIDGQQRMTTLQIMLEVAKRLFQAEGFSFAATQLAHLTRNDVDPEADPDSEHQFKVWPTNIDRDPFRKVMTGQKAGGLMQEASEFFESQIATWLKPTNEGAKERAGAFVQAVNHDLVFVAIDLTDEDDDGQLIFETLNALGTPLLPSDLVKNLLFREAIAQKLNTEKLYADHWRQFEEDAHYWRHKVKVGRRERPRVDVFLQHYLTLNLNKEPNLAHQFREYREALREGKVGSVSDAMADLSNHAGRFRGFDEATDGAQGSFRALLRVLDLTVPTPLVLGILSNCEDPASRDAMLSILESYFVRRFLCAWTNKNYNLVVLSLIAHCKRSGWTPITLREALQSFDGASNSWPTDSDVIGRITQKHSYGDIRSTGIAYVLSRVEASMRTAKSEAPWNLNTELTVEHIMPRRWEPNWPLDPDTEDAKRRRYEIVDRMGNLTVLTQALNSSVSNACWAEKRNHLSAHSVLRMNNELAKHESWSEVDVEIRGAQLALQFCELWPR